MGYKDQSKISFVSESIHDRLKDEIKDLVVSKLNCTSNVEFTDSSDSNAVVLGRCYNLDNRYKIQDYEALFIGENGKTLATITTTIPAYKWYHYDTRTTEMREFSSLNSPWLKRRRFLVEKLKDAKVVAIVVATLGISDFLTAISTTKQILKKVGKKSYILSVGKINCAKLANFAEVRYLF